MVSFGETIKIKLTFKVNFDVSRISEKRLRLREDV